VKGQSRLCVCGRVGGGSFAFFLMLTGAILLFRRRSRQRSALRHKESLRLAATKNWTPDDILDYPQTFMQQFYDLKTDMLQTAPSSTRTELLDIRFSNETALHGKIHGSSDKNAESR